MWPGKPVILEMKVTLTLSWRHNQPPFLHNFFCFLFFCFLHFTVLLWYFRMQWAVLTRSIVAMIDALGSSFLLSYFETQQWNTSKTFLSPSCLTLSCSHLCPHFSPNISTSFASTCESKLVCFGLCCHVQLFSHVSCFCCSFPNT